MVFAAHDEVLEGGVGGGGLFDVDIGVGIVVEELVGVGAGGNAVGGAVGAVVGFFADDFDFLFGWVNYDIGLNEADEG